MRNNYVGDVGDFYKYGLLCHLAGEDLKLGVVWYLYPDPCKAGDGNQLAYLEDDKRDLFAPCDEELYEKLKGRGDLKI